MKAICVDAYGFTYNYPLTEGDVYDVYDSPHNNHYYKVVGYEFNRRGGGANYHKSRFIPLSTIDEMALVNQLHQTQ